MTSTEAIVLPIGQYFGTFYPTVNSPERVHNVRLHGDVRELDDQRFAVWGLLHGMPEWITKRAWSRAAMQDAVDAAAESGTAPPVAPVLDSLVAEGLAVELPPGTDAAVDFASRHRMVPRMLGLGNSATEPWMYEIGYFDNPVVKVTNEVFQLWQACTMDDTLLQTCESIAESARESNMTDPERTDPARVAAGFLASIHNLLLMSVVYLEPRR